MTAIVEMQERVQVDCEWMRRGERRRLLRKRESSRKDGKRVSGRFDCLGERVPANRVKERKQWA